MSDEGIPSNDIIVRTLQRPDMTDVIKHALPPYVPLERFMATAVSAFRTTPPEVFANCDRQSIYNAVVQAARQGLLIDGRHGWIVPFREKKRDGTYITKAQFLIGPQGIIDAFARVGVTAYATSVYEHDQSRFWDDTDGQHVSHQFDPFTARGEFRGAFACARSRDGRVWVEAMGMEELNRVRESSKAPDSPAWRNWPERMHQKSCLHRLAKRVPGVDVSDDEDPRQVVQVASGETPKLDRPRALQAIMDGASTAPSEVPELPDGAPGTPGTSS